MAKRFNVFVGYYEVLITTKKDIPYYSFFSWHKRAENATKLVEREFPSATILYDEDAMNDMDWGWAMEDSEPIVDENGMKWWQ